MCFRKAFDKSLGVSPDRKLTSSKAALINGYHLVKASGISEKEGVATEDKFSWHIRTRLCVAKRGGAGYIHESYN
jgi:hypothetical protein